MQFNGRPPSVALDTRHKERVLRYDTYFRLRDNPDDLRWRGLLWNQLTRRYIWSFITELRKDGDVMGPYREHGIETLQQGKANAERKGALAFFVMFMGGGSVKDAAKITGGVPKYISPYIVGPAVRFRIEDSAHPSAQCEHCRVIKNWNEFIGRNWR